MIGPTHCPPSDSSRISGLCLEKTFTGIMWTDDSEALRPASHWPGHIGWSEPLQFEWHQPRTGVN